MALPIDSTRPKYHENCTIAGPIETFSLLIFPLSIKEFFSSLHEEKINCQFQQTDSLPYPITSDKDKRLQDFSKRSLLLTEREISVYLPSRIRVPSEPPHG